MKKTKRLTFVTGERAVYDLTPEELEDLMEHCQDIINFHQVSPECIWVSDLKFIERKLEYIRREHTEE